MSNKTKEEVYQEATLKNLSDPNGTRMDIVYAAMDDWAKQESFLFSEFKASYKIIESMNHRHNVTDKIGMVMWIGASDEEIWEAYKKGEQLKRWFETEDKK